MKEKHIYAIAMLITTTLYIFDVISFEVAVLEGFVINILAQRSEK